MEDDVEALLAEQIAYYRAHAPDYDIAYLGGPPAGGGGPGRLSPQRHRRVRGANGSRGTITALDPKLGP